jgi:YVTN family beta-propeller protein
MAIYSTGIIQNRENPRTVKVTINLSNEGKLPALAAVEIYSLVTTSGGFSRQIFNHINLIGLGALGSLSGEYRVEDLFSDYEQFAVRIVTSGLGERNITVTVLEKNSLNQVIEKHILRGEMTNLPEQLNVYAANVTGRSISVIDAATLSVIAESIIVGNLPAEIALSPDGIRAYVTVSGDNQVTVINTASNAITHVITGISNPQGIAITPDGILVYVANFNLGTVTVISTISNTVVALFSVGSLPVGLAISPDGLKDFVANSGSNTVSAVNRLTNTVMANIPVGVNPFNIVFTPDSTRAYVTNLSSNTISVIDTTTLTVTGTIFTAASPNGIAITPDGSRIYVANQDANVVSVISTATGFGIAVIPVTSPTRIAITPDGTRAYITNVNDNLISVVNTLNNSIIAAIPAGLVHRGIAITPLLLM